MRILLMSFIMFIYFCLTKNVVTMVTKMLKHVKILFKVLVPE